MASPNTFEGARLDRVTARRRDADWVAERLVDPASRAVVAAETAVLVDGERLALVELPELLAHGAEPLLLGVQDERALFAVDAASLDGRTSRRPSSCRCATSRRASPRTTAA